MTEALTFQIVDEPGDTPPGRVYLDFYQLSEAPFAITPDPEFLFSSSCHRQVLDKIGYAIDGHMGFVLLTGEVGTGKTTVCRTLLDRLGSSAETVYVINPSVSGHDLLAGILEDLGESPPAHASKKMLIDQLNQRLLADGTQGPFVVIIDDAQTMTLETLEDLRLLSNLETDKRKLIQVILSGQPELMDLLTDQRLRQLKQRIAVHCRLEPLTVGETAQYISRRLFVAGNTGQVNFSPAALRLVHKISGGIPRLINKICDFALTAGYVKDASTIGPDHVRRALAELDGPDWRRAHHGGGPRLRIAWQTVALLLMVLIGVVFFMQRPGDSNPDTRIQPIADSIHSNPKPSPATPLTKTGSDGSVGLLEADEALQFKTTVAPRKDLAAASLVRQSDSLSTTARGETTVTGSPASQPAPYALQLASFRALSRAQRGAAQYRKQGVPAHWQMVADGQWYRIVAGKFESVDQASGYRREQGLHGALIIRAPWALRVLPGQPEMENAQIVKLLTQIGYDCLMEPGVAGNKEIYTGIFMSVADASLTAERINRSGQLLAQVVTR